jgi:RNA polymerase sigma-70 factor (ECF subfamily)
LQLSPSGELSRAEDAAALAAAMEKLPDDYRQVIRLRHREGKSFAEIARVLERSEDAVGKLWARALQSLSRELNRG